MTCKRSLWNEAKLQKSYIEQQYMDIPNPENDLIIFFLCFMLKIITRNILSGRNYNTDNYNYLNNENLPLEICIYMSTLVKNIPIVKVLMWSCHIKKITI